MSNVSKSRHLRWNWEVSPDNEYDGNPMVRYHVVVVDDRIRESRFEKIFEQIDQLRGGIVPIRKCEGKVVGTEFRYLFRSFDSSVSPNEVKWGKIMTKVYHDIDLRERKSGSEGIETYVENKYS